jgi:hypothetical protein
MLKRMFIYTSFLCMYQCMCAPRYVC